MAWWDGKPGWLAGPADKIEATSRAVKALLQAAPDEPLLADAVAWLCHQKRERHWASTKATAEAVHALSLYFAKRGEFRPNYFLHVVVNGDTVLSRHIDSTSVAGPSKSISVRPPTPTAVSGYIFCKFLHIPAKSSILCPV